jgi:hypothetical protein
MKDHICACRYAIVAIYCALFAVGATAEDHITLRIRVVCNADVLTEKCDFAHKLDDGVFVLEDFVLYRREKKYRDIANDAERRKNPIDITVTKHTFEPRVFKSPPGSFVRFPNPERFACDPNFHFFENSPFGGVSGQRAQPAFRIASFSEFRSN